MREFVNWCLVLFVAVSSVQTSVVYRKYRGLDDNDANKNVQQQDIMQEVISELRKEVIPVEVVDIIDPMLIIKEKVILPESNTFVEIEEIKEPSPTIDKKESIQSVEIKEIAPVSVAVNEVLLPKNVQEEQRSEDNNLEQNIEEENQADIIIVPSSPSSPSSSLQQQDLIQDEEILNEDNSVTSLKQSNTTFRPTLFQQAQQSLGQFIDTIRRPLSPLTSTRAPGDVVAVAAVDTSTNPNLLQQFQASVQNIGSQITNALIPNQNLDGSSTPRPPNLLENLQTNFQNVVSNVFRPPTETSAAGPNPTPVGPFQAVISNVQSFFTGGGNRVGEATTPQSIKPENVEDPNKPVDEQNLRNSEENKDSAEQQQQQEIIVGEADDSSE